MSNEYKANEKFLRKGIHKTKYVTIHFDDIDDVYLFIESISNSLGEYWKNVKKEPNLIDERIDNMVVDISKLMNVDRYGFDTNVVLVKTLNEVHSLRRENDKSVKSVMTTDAFYLPSKNIIYISLEKCSDDLLKHELIHALQYRTTGFIDEDLAYKLL